MGHDLRGVSIRHVDVHVVVSIAALTLSLLVVLLDLVVTLALDINAAILGHLLIVAGVLDGLGDTVHAGVQDGAGSLAIGLGNLLRGVLSIVQVNLICAVLVVIRGQIGLGLLRRELGRCGGVVVPGRRLLVNLSVQDGSKGSETVRTT